MSEDKLKEFAEGQEGAPKEAKITPIQPENTKTPVQDAANKIPVGSPIIKPDMKSMPWEKDPEQVELGSRIGWQQIDMKDLPTQGLFYPEGTQIAIRSATAAEIRHWSTINEDDLYVLDDMLNYIVERCSAIKFPDGISSWKDIKEVDRFYVILAIRERTFSKGENLLQVKVSETEKVTVTKDMIDYINFDDRLMKYYDPEKRTIVLKFKTGKSMPIYMTSSGVTNWLKNYINRKQQMQESFDQDFINFAPLVIPDWRGLTDSTYEKFVYESMNWSNSEISMLTKVREIFADTINPVVKYRDEQGGERQVPLTFLGGIKSLFLISDPFSELA